MVQRGEQVLGLGGGARRTISVRATAALLAGEVRIGSPLLARFGLVGLALALQTVVLSLPGHFRPATNGAFAVLVAGATLLSLALCLLAVIPAIRTAPLRSRQILGASALLALTILPFYGVPGIMTGVRAVLAGTPYNNDGAVMDLYAAERVLGGHNPYAAANIVAALAEVNAPSTTTTPLMDGQFRGSSVYPSEQAVNQVFMNVLNHRSTRGVPTPVEFESKYNYPAGSFLFILPFVWIGMHDLRFLYALALFALGAYIWWRTPRTLRLLVPALIVSDVPLLRLTAGGQPDTIYGFFLAIGLAEWSTPWIAPLALGVAVGTKQLAWFFVPFYLILLYQRFGLRCAAQRLGVLLGLAMLMNLPFVAASPSSYITSIAGPMQDPMFPLGVGIIALFVTNALPLLPKFVFSSMEVAAWLGGMAAFARWRVLSAASVATLGALPLYFAWRSLVNYFYLVPFLALAVYLASRGTAEARHTGRTAT